MVWVSGRCLLENVRCPLWPWIHPQSSIRQSRWAALQLKTLGRGNLPYNTMAPPLVELRMKAPLEDHKGKKQWWSDRRPVKHGLFPSPKNQFSLTVVIMMSDVWLIPTMLNYLCYIKNPRSASEVLVCSPLDLSKNRISNFFFEGKQISRRTSRGLMQLQLEQSAPQVQVTTFSMTAVPNTYFDRCCCSLALLRISKIDYIRRFF